MDIIEDITKEKEMSGKKVAVQQNQRQQKILKVKRDVNHQWEK